MYFKDYVNDTIYILENNNLQPVYVFDFGKYSYPEELLTNWDMTKVSSKYALIQELVGTPKFFFYRISSYGAFSVPKIKPFFSPIHNRLVVDRTTVYGLYDIEQNTNMLLDTDQHLQNGIVNDLNGGLPFLPRYYAGDGIVVGEWKTEEMKEMLTEEYFALQTIKDKQAHQKLKEVLKNLRDDDNPVVVIARLK